MKLYKKLVLALGVTVIVIAPLLSMAPMLTGHASAAPIDSASYADESKSYVLLDAVAGCFRKSALSTQPDTGPQRITADHAVNFNWFGAWRGATSASQTKTGIGYLDDSGNSDGWVYCDETDWLSSALGLWGLDSNPIQTLCDIGFTRSSGDCTTGSGDLLAPSTGLATAATNFIKLVNQKYYGTNSSSLPSRSAAAKYVFYSQNFLTLCGVSPYGQGDSLSDSDIASSANPNLFRMTGADGKTKVTYKSSSKKHDSIVTVSDNTDGSLHNLSCWNLTQYANDNAKAYANGDKDKQGGIDDGTGSTIDDTSDGVDLKCSGFSINPATLIGQILTLKWILCPLINGFQAAAGELDNGIMDMLCVNEQQVFSPSAQSTCSNSAKVISSTSTGYKNAWNVFRLIALGLLAIAALVMILSQTSGMEIVDAYTVRKVLPRLLVAAIGITLSWQLMEFFVGLSNILGVGIRGLIYAPFVDAGINKAVVGGGTNAILFLTSLGGLAFLGPLGILSFVATGLLAIVIAFFVLVLRNLLIVILLITAPVAIAAYILPNTEKYWKIWWEWFSKALMVFPIITAFIAVGHIFAAIATAQASTQGGVTSIVSQTAGFIAYFAPYFLIPTAFRFAGGALSTIGGFVNDRNRGAFDRLKKFRGNQAAYNAQRMRDGERFNNAALNTLTSRATTRNFGFGRRGQAAYTEKMNDAAIRHFKGHQGQSGQHNDNMLRAQTYASEHQARANMAQDWNMWQRDNAGNLVRDANGNTIADNEAIERSVAAAKANGGFGANRQVYAAKRLSETGTGYDNIEQVAQTVARVSHGNEETIGDVAGAINFSTKQSGRWDLAPGAGNLINLSRAASDGTMNMADVHAASVAASRGADPVSIIRGKPQEVANLTNALGDHARAQQLRMANSAAGSAEHNAASEEFLRTMGQIDQLEASKSYGPSENQEHVNALLADTQDLRTHTLEGMLGTPAMVPVPVTDPRTGITRNEIMRDPTWEEASLTAEQVRNRNIYSERTSQQRPDPNDPNQNL